MLNCKLLYWVLSIIMLLKQQMLIGKKLIKLHWIKLEMMQLQTG